MPSERAAATKKILREGLSGRPLAPHAFEARWSWRRCRALTQRQAVAAPRRQTLRVTAECRGIGRRDFTLEKRPVGGEHLVGRIASQHCAASASLSVL